MRTSLLANRLVVASTLGVVLLSDGSAYGQARPTPMFTRDVAPIFQEKCEACHRPGSVAPMSLVTFEDARPWVRSIKSRVASRHMPPWHIDRTIGIRDFKNDRSLSDQQIETIVRWVDAGAPKGDPKDMPKLLEWKDSAKWNYAELFGGPPDLIIQSPPYTMPAVAQDVWFRRTVPTGLTEPRWVRAIEVRPRTNEGRRIVHHVTAQLEQDEPPSPESNDAPPIGPAYFMEWAVGKQGETMREDSGKLMLPGSNIRFSVHYHAVGTEITDSVELGVYFYPKHTQPKYRQHLVSVYASNSGVPEFVDIRPNSIAVSSGVRAMPRAGRIESFQPHMHLRGKAMLMEAILPDNSVQVLSYISDFDFSWMTNYFYADHAAPLLPKGTLLRVTAWHDNTAANKNNPDPEQWVGHGDRTVDEMAHAWVNITYLSDEEYRAEQSRRRGLGASR